tara:strand:+ start:12335 stop:12568 length:234 start_codon:yes stop_codon:yes gene_type:complete
MLKDTISKAIGSISRAVGNDLVEYETTEDNTYVLKMWPPISQDNKRLLVQIVKDFLPKAKISINKRAGTVTIVIKSR